MKDFETKNFSHILESDCFKKRLKGLYGSDDDIEAKQKDRYKRLLSLFTGLYPGHDKFRIFSTPGRTEIGGNHTDHQKGRVLCASVDMDILAFAAPNARKQIRLKSEGFSSFDIIDLDNLSAVEGEKNSSAPLIRGIAFALKDKGYRIGGFDAYTTSMVPKGSGLSSSAAFEITVASILNGLFNESAITPLDLALASQFAENHYFGKPSGLMDQCGCAFGGIMTIDFEDDSNVRVETMDIDFFESGHRLVITDTGGSHGNLTDEYAAIPNEMRAVAGFFDQEVLRRVDEDAFYRSLPELVKALGEAPVLRAMHFFDDNRRVLQQVEALKAKDFELFFYLVKESGLSSWTLLRNIFPVSDPARQELAMGLALSAKILAGKGASRVHGGGFAGTIQAFVPQNLLPDYVNRMEELFGEGACKIIRIRNTPAGEVFAGL